VWSLEFGRCGLPVIQIPSDNSCRTPRDRSYQAKNWTDTVQKAARRDRPSKRGIAREFGVVFTAVWSCGGGRSMARENSFEERRWAAESLSRRAFWPTTLARAPKN
jgi:hypothetical protein